MRVPKVAEGEKKRRKRRRTQKKGKTQQEDNTLGGFAKRADSTKQKD